MIKILLIESDSIDATWTAAFLHRVYDQDGELFQAGSVEEAIDAFRDAPLDAILLALQPPTEPWRECVRRLDEVRPLTPIIVLATDGNDALAAEVFAAGAVEFLVKSQITINWIKRAINYAIHRKRLTEDIRKSESRFLGIINLCGDAIVSTDERHRITLFNIAAERMFGYSANEALGQPLAMLMPAALRAAHDAHMQHFARGPAAARPMSERGELVAQRRDGEIFPVEISISKLHSASGTVFTAIVRDATERKRTEEQLRDLAMTDPLTGIANRRRLLDVAEQELKRSYRYDHPLSVLLIDIDDFKNINDTLGHAAGDQALLRVTIACNEILRKNDTFGRLGGDEFMALLPETDEIRAEILARRLVDHVAAIEIPLALNSFRLTMSIGCSMVDDADQAISAVIERADRALMNAKRTGRNRVSSWMRDVGGGTSRPAPGATP